MSFIYIISKLFTYIFLPPGKFIVAFFIASFFVKRLKLLFLSISVLFYLLSIEPVANLLLEPLEEPYNKPVEFFDADAVVVLDGGSMLGSANLPLSTESFKRAMFGIMLAHKNNLPLIYTGVSAANHSNAFLDVVKELQDYFGLNISVTDRLTKDFSIVLEKKSVDTYQNAAFTKKLFEKQNILHPKIYLVTSAYHMKRSLKLYRHFGFDAYPAATDFKIAKKKTGYFVFSFFPNIGDLNRSYVALHEYFGLLSLIIRGL